MLNQKGLRAEKNRDLKDTPQRRSTEKGLTQLCEERFPRSKKKGEGGGEVKRRKVVRPSKKRETRWAPGKGSSKGSDIWLFITEAS